MKPMDEEQLLAHVNAALAGDGDALEKLLAALKDPLFQLALRTLGNFADAEDATQEVLVKVMTALSSFERRSSIRTWAFRIALNHLRDFATKRHRTAAQSLDALAAQLEQGISASPNLQPLGDATDPALALEAREIGLHCVQGILMHLDLEQRTAYVLCEVFDFDTRTAARVLGITEAAFRQRLSRARRRLEDFMSAHCGLINADAPCTCVRQAQAVRHARNGKPLTIRFAHGDDPSALAKIHAARAELSRLQRIALVFRTTPEWSAPDGMLAKVRDLLGSSPLFSGRLQ